MILPSNSRSGGNIHPYYLREHKGSTDQVPDLRCIVVCSEPRAAELLGSRKYASPVSAPEMLPHTFAVQD